MADKQNTPSSGDSSQASSNTFSKGMFKDYNETFIGEGIYTHARNGVNNSHDGQVGVIGNEPSNLKCVTLNYTMVGCIHLLDDEWLILSTDDTNSEIGIFDESACTYTPIKNKNGDKIDCSCLGLKKTNLITGVFRKRYDCERIVYWDDGLNPTRTMDIDNVPCIQDCSTPSPNCTLCVDTIYLDCEAIRIAPIVEHPCINISKGTLPGTLPNGSYQACIAYTVNQLRVTDYIGLTEVQGIWSHENTSGSLKIDITKVDASFNEFELVILSNINAQTVAKRIGYYNTSKGTIYVDRWDTETVNIPVGDIVFRSEPIETSDAMYTVNNYLLRIGTRSKFKFNYQPLANQIKANWLSVEYPKNYYQKGGNNVSYMRDELYSFFIRFVYNTGEFSESYHIPGRPSGQSDTVIVNGQDVFEGSLPKWKVYNTASLNSASRVPYSLADGGRVIARGEMGYWESAETYASDKPNIWNSFPNLAVSPYNLCGQPIRHHKMPDETVGNGELNLYDNSTDNIRLLGVTFDNIQRPVDNYGKVITTILGYEILRGSREGNKSIIAKGLLNNMRDYKIPNNSNRGLFVNYPYNDLREDGYLFDDSQGVGRPTGYNSGFAGEDYTNKKMNSFKKDMFSFHSPDTTFSKPYLNASEIKLYNEHAGVSQGSFQTPYKTPKSKVAAGFVSILLAFVDAMNFIDTLNKAYSSEAGVAFTGTDEIPLEFSYKFPEFPKWPAMLGSDAVGASSTLALIAALAWYIIQVGLFIVIAAALIVLSVALSDAKTQKVYDIFYALMPTRSFAAQYTSHGFYNKYNPITIQDNRRRNIVLANYIGSGIQQFGLTHQINNINRGIGDIVIQLGNKIEPTNKDKSRVTAGEAGVVYNENFQSDIASYYGALKIPMISQYGQLESIKQIPVSTCIRSIGSTSTGSTPLFGGDVYVNRFTQKNTMFFFNSWLLGQPDNYEFNYCNYINIPYPRWWLNSEQYRVHAGNSPTRQRSLDNTSTGGAIQIKGKAAVPLFVDKGFFYLFNSGVRDFFCESEVNIAFRDYEDNDITKRFYDPYGFASIEGDTSMFRSDPEIITAGNYYKYDYALSKSKLFNSSITWGETLPRDYNPEVAQSCYVYRPNRVIYSLPQQDGSKKDNWRAFLTNNYKDFPSRVSSIKPIHKTGALFMMKYANPQMFMGVEELKLSESGTKVTIGDGALFSSGGVSQLQSVVNSDESYEYGSNQGRFCAINCIHGVFWVSQNQGKIFQYGGGSGIQEISAGGGMRWWFAKYLPSELLKKFPAYPYYDNPVAGVGVQMIYDNTHELIYITKKDYIPKGKQTLAYTGVFTNGIPVAPGPVCPAGFYLQNGVCVSVTPTCPDGYIYDDAQNLCVKVETINATQAAPTRIQRTPFSVYGFSGTKVHNGPTLDSTFTVLNTSNPFWIRNNTVTPSQANDLNNGPVNRLAIWGDGPNNNYNLPSGGSIPPTDIWIGFTVCLNITQEKTYQVCIAGDNFYRLSLNDTVILETPTGIEDNFKFLHIYPITIPAGNFILKLEGRNSLGQAGFGCEVFDLTSVASSQAQVVTYLNAQTNYTNLDPLTIFTTRGITSFTSNLYSCPTGYGTPSNINCGAVPTCSRTLTAAATYKTIPATIPTQVIPSDFNNKEDWEEISWTISYDPKIKAWVSFHDWIPTFLIPGRAHFMSVAPESGSIVDSIWKHNIRCESYCNYYGVNYPFEIEFVSATGQTVNSMRSIEYILEAYNYSNDCRDKFHNYYENFDQAIVYNSEQVSGLLRLNLHTKNDPLALLAYPKINTALGYIDIQYSKVENKYRFNQFWDITKNRGQALPSPLNIPMFNTNGNGYIYPINPAYVNYAKSPLEHKKFRHNVNRVFLRRMVSGNNKFLFKISNQKNLQSPR